MPVFFYDVSKLHPDDLTGILVSENAFVGFVNNYPVRRNAVPYESVELFANNDRTYRVYVKTPDLNVVDLTSAVGVLTIRPDPESTAVITKSTAVAGEGQLGTATDGEMFFYIIPADTVNLDIRQYSFDVTVTLASGKVYTVLDGVINLTLP